MRTVIYAPLRGRVYFDKVYFFPFYTIRPLWVPLTGVSEFGFIFGNRMVNMNSGTTDYAVHVSLFSVRVHNTLIKRVTIF